MDKRMQNSLDAVIEYFSSGPGSVVLNNYRRGHISREDFMGNIREHIETYKLKKEEQEMLFEAYKEFTWGYSVLKPLIDDPEIFDIHCNAYNNIRVKQKVGRKTIRVTSEVEFDSPKQLRDFIGVLVLRNKLQLKDQDAQQFFVDKESHPDFRLRCDITTEYLNCEPLHFLHIRKEPKVKKLLPDLLADGMITADLMTVCKNAALGPMIVSGESGSGKSVFLNAEIEERPFDKSALIIQDADELYGENHPDTIAFHTVSNKRSKNRIEYTFHDLAKTAMLMDRDCIIFSEVKGREAADVFTCAMTDHNPWLTLHAGSNRAAAYQFANLVHMTTGYALTDIFRMLSFIQFTLFHLTDFVVDEVTVMEGWDEEKQEIIFRDILKKGGRM